MPACWQGLLALVSPWVVHTMPYPWLQQHACAFPGTPDTCAYGIWCSICVLAGLFGYVVYPTQELTSGVRDISLLQNRSVIPDFCIKPLTNSTTPSAQIPDMQVSMAFVHVKFNCYVAHALRQAMRLVLPRADAVLALMQRMLRL